jgi:RES domain
MSEGLASVQPDRPVYRVARPPDAWAWPDWVYATDGTFGNRWDDPSSSYRVLYACSQRVGAFVETLARFRPDMEVFAALADIDGPDDGPLPGVVPGDWRPKRIWGEAIISGRFADVGDANSLTTLRMSLASRAIHYRLKDIDGAAIRLSAPRAFTQEVSRFIYESTNAGSPFTGIRYQSRLGDAFVNWAIFEPLPAMASPLVSVTNHPIAADDPDLLEALRILGLKPG